MLALSLSLLGCSHATVGDRFDSVDRQLAAMRAQLDALQAQQATCKRAP
jgi:hypothetical protein